MQSLVEQMNRVLEDWKEQYDLSDGIQAKFGLDADGRLCWNDRDEARVIGFAGEPDLVGADYEGEHVVFCLSDDRRIYINVMWPEDEAPFIQSVLFGYVF